MRYFVVDQQEGPRLVVESDGRAVDVTSVNRRLESFRDLARAAAIGRRGIDTVAHRLLEENTDPIDTEIVDERAGQPVVPDEVWAAGVTYRISEEARETESALPELYMDVYEADRPEIFFKATASRTVGPNESVGIRGDSDWNVPEPELGLVLYDGEVVGYTVGNDVSSRSIEGRNPLYLPQAKTYAKCCAIGPCVASPETVADPLDLEMSMEIHRDGEVVYDDGTSTSQIVRTIEELTGYLARHNTLPELTVLLTGTSLVPPDEFTLQADDTVSITIENIGTLTNTVTVV